MVVGGSALHALARAKKDEINVLMALSVFRDGDRSPRSGGRGDGTYLITVELPLLSPE